MGKEEQLKKKAKIERFRGQLLSDYNATFKTEASMRVLDDLLTKCFFFNSTFTGNAGTNKNEGKREIALYILSAIAQKDSNIAAKALINHSELKKYFNEN